jgi:hypothetical protein
LRSSASWNIAVRLLALLLVAGMRPVALVQAGAAPPSSTPTATPTPLPPPGSASGFNGVAGDCNQNAVVSIDELVRGVSIALERQALANCPAFDTDGNGRVSVDELVRAVNIALHGAPPTFTPTQVTSGDLVTLTGSSPANGEGGVAVTRETVLRFSGPVDPSSVSEQSITAVWAGFAMFARRHVSPDRHTVTLFYETFLPASARVRVIVNGGLLRAANGTAVDADGDGRPGGVANIDFDTLNLTTLPGTTVCGRVFASEPIAGQSGASMNVPLPGVTIEVDGAPDMKAVTDELGNFRLEPAPVGRFFVFIRGKTATIDVPPGAYYPDVGKAWQSVAGIETNIGEIYLPLIAADTLQLVSRTEDTEIGFPPSVLALFPELADVRIMVPADSLFADDGTRGGMVGIAPVPPDRIPSPLPPGLEFPVVITVQTDGAQNFDGAVSACFPNLRNPNTLDILAPGSKSALWSFNHDTGRFEVVGPMTVSSDGRLVCTDAGVGIRAPGWHGTQPGVGAGGGPILGSGNPSCSIQCGECTVALCDPPRCEPAPDGAACGGTQCSHCSGGQCQPSASGAAAGAGGASGDLCAPCENDSDCGDCLTCDAGVCVPDAIQEGVSCDDGDDCSQNDVCGSGTCAGEPMTCEACTTCSGGECKPCTNCQVCSDAGNCLPDESKNGAPCGMDQACLNGECGPGLLLEDPADGTRFDISTAPAMPVVMAKARIVGIDPDPTSTTSFEWVTQIRSDFIGNGCPHARPGRTIDVDFPPQTAVGGDITLNLGPDVRGGDLNLIVRADVTMDGETVTLEARTRDVLIRGTNPQRAAIQGALPHDTLRRIACQESRQAQFNAAADGGMSECPLFSGDNFGGVGIGQITNPAPSPDDHWSWRSNVTTAANIFNGKIPIATNYPAQVRNAGGFMALVNQFNTARQASGLPPVRVTVPSFATGDFTSNANLRERELDTIRGYNGFAPGGDFGFAMHELRVKRTAGVLVVKISGGTPRCVGGTEDTKLCSSNADCPGGTCAGRTTCRGGTKNGQVCAMAADCPSGSCEGSGESQWEQVPVAVRPNNFGEPDYVNLVLGRSPACP